MSNNADLDNHLLSEHQKTLMETKLEDLEKELVSERLKCKKHCRIFHTRFNWKRSKSEKILDKMQAL